MLKKRIIEKRLRLLAHNFKVILVTGARQVGKRTLLRKVFPHLTAITFDPSQDIRGARSQPDDFLNNHPSPLILDEIQYAPELLPALKRRVDLSPETGQYFLTGSHNLSMMKSVSESMAGRVGIINLSSMNIHELTEQTSAPSWLSLYLNNPDDIIPSFERTISTHTPTETLWRGGMPGIIPLESSLIPDYFQGYTRTYLERDVQLHTAPKNLREFRSFLGVMAALTAQELNYAKLTNNIETTHETIKRWLNALDASYLWYEIKPYVGNTLKRVSKRGKGYLFDTGLACFLQRLSSPQAISESPLRGALFETYCVHQVRTLMASLSTKPEMFHWRTSGGAEVDLILMRDGKLFPIEIKSKTNLTGHDARGIRAFKETYGDLVQDGIILYTGNECYRLSENVIALPWNALMKSHD